LNEELGLVICKTCRHSIKYQRGFVAVVNHLRVDHNFILDLEQHSEVFDEHVRLHYRSDATIIKAINLSDAFNPIPHLKVVFGYGIQP
jgi:hypothetical protein